ncbi:hypothetical protein [Amycolatopsis sp. GA6-003]|uniref:hypothetical protein n=1 Tax=Amycolatopsis sp. GA6-003 TaxID=2652444 RepID=UPI0039174CCC
MAVTAIWLVVVGDVLLGMGAVMAIAEPAGPGFNFGAAGSLFFGQCATGLGLLIAVAAAAVRLRDNGRDGRPPVRILPQDKRLRRLTAVAIGLCAVGAVVLGVGPAFFSGPPGSGFTSDIPVFAVGLGISAAGVLTGLPPVLHWRKNSDRFLHRA